MSDRTRDEPDTQVSDATGDVTDSPANVRETPDISDTLPTVRSDHGPPGQTSLLLSGTSPVRPDTPRHARRPAAPAAPRFFFPTV